MVRELGLLRRARWFYALVFAVLCLAVAGACVGFALLGDSWWQLLIAGVFGVACTQFAFLAHEASHRQIFASGPANDRVGRLLGTLLVGISYSWWMGKHTRHHGNPNRVGKDPDIAPGVVSFRAEDAAAQRGFLAMMNRRQGYAFFPLLTLEGVNLHVSSIRFLFGRGKITGRWTEIGLIAAHLALIIVPAFVFLSRGWPPHSAVCSWRSSASTWARRSHPTTRACRWSARTRNSTSSPNRYEPRATSADASGRAR
ncbi:hypothetical protein Asera_29330 [Actinocatenispora sera]|uniref:Fatty acid desaturase domain-containing protein n=1 Tax=Actinocatenispora sera TaxID=390989 RepID=A0A810L1Q6_9ACTN|nr:hypothetical protein Asera_29330 [Actinocatenispora sera]